MTIEKLIEELLKIEDKTCEVVTFDGGRYSYMYKIDEVYDSGRGIIILHEGEIFTDES